MIAFQIPIFKILMKFSAFSSMLYFHLNFLFVVVDLSWFPVVSSVKMLAGFCSHTPKPFYSDEWFTCNSSVHCYYFFWSLWSSTPWKKTSQPNDGWLSCWPTDGQQLTNCWLTVLSPPSGRQLCQPLVKGNWSPQLFIVQRIVDQRIQNYCLLVKIPFSRLVNNR